MKIGLVGYPGSGKSTVFGALTGLDVATGYGAGKANLGAVKVPDARVDALARLYEPKKTHYAEITFSDLEAGKSEGPDRATSRDSPPAPGSRSATWGRAKARASTARRSTRCATSTRCARCCARFPTPR